MSDISYSHIKFIVRSIGLGAFDITRWQGIAQSENIETKIGEDNVIEWSLSMSSRDYITYNFNINVIKVKRTDNINLSTFLYFEPTPRVLESKIKIFCSDNGHGWSIRKSELALKMLGVGACSYDGILCVINEPSLQSLKSLCEQYLMTKITLNNVLEMLTYAVTFGAKKIEGKCLEMILQNFDELKDTQAWKNLRPSVLASVNDLLKKFASKKSFKYRQFILQRQEESSGSEDSFDEHERMRDEMHDQGILMEDEESGDDSFKSAMSSF